MPGKFQEKGGEAESSIGRALMENLGKAGFTGDIFPVNPNHDAIQGQKAYPSVTEIGGKVDLAIVAAPISKDLRLGKKLGFQTEWDQEAREYRMTIDLSRFNEDV